MIYQEMRDAETEMLEKNSAEWLMAKLSPEERDILNLWVIQELSFAKIGEIVGAKYYGASLPDTTVRYRKDKILAQLQEFREEAGI